MITVFLLSLFGLILLNVPISLALIGTAGVMMYLTGGFSAQILTQGLVRGIDNFPLLAIPFFMIAGEIMNQGGISRRIVRFAHVLVGHISGGIGYVGILSSMVFAGVSGSAIADTAAVGSVLVPVMNNHGYDTKRSTGLICSAGCIGPIIPPSIPMILYGVTAGVSIVKLFLGGIIPGILIAVVLSIVWFFHTRRRNYKSETRATWKELVSSTIDAFWALLLPIIILGGIVFGVVTPTEAAVIAVVYAFLIAMFVYHDITIKDIPEILVASMKSTASIMFVVGGATAAAYMITTVHIPEMLTGLIVSHAANAYTLLFLINILLLLVGCVLDTAPAILLLTPILLPIVVQYGLNPIHFGVVMVMNLCLGLLTPPVGAVLYVGSGLSRLSIVQLTKGMLPFLLAMIGVLFAITYFPDLVLVTTRYIK